MEQTGFSEYTIELPWKTFYKNQIYVTLLKVINYTQCIVSLFLILAIAIPYGANGCIPILERAMSLENIYNNLKKYKNEPNPKPYTKNDKINLSKLNLRLQNGNGACQLHY